MTTLEKIREEILNFKEKCNASDYLGCGILEIIDRYAEQEPCDDAISRQAVLKLQYRIDDSATLSTRDVVNVEDIEDLPPVTPQPKTGHWILKRAFPTKLYDEYLNEYKCSECYREIRCTESQLVNYPYCHCGARMVWTQESEVNNG